MIHSISGQIVDVINREIFPGTIFIEKGKIIRTERIDDAGPGYYILPGLIDAHVHVESSMLTPVNFAEVAVRHGTVAVVSDPHEIANVLGIEGVRFMIRDAGRTPVKFYFGAPSCVPATKFETSGGEITADDIGVLFREENVLFLSEVMNFPGVITEEHEIMNKIQIARNANRRIDGHAPALRGAGLDKYISAGIETDHECLTYDEGVEKIQKGMKIMIREGSAAKNFDALFRLIDEYPDSVFLCTDDLHPQDLLNGHIDAIIRMGIDKKIDLFNLLRCATYNPVTHYGLTSGLLRENDPADFIIVEDLESFIILETYIEGKAVYRRGEKQSKSYSSAKPNNFNISQVNSDAFRVKDSRKPVKVIEALNGQIITGKSEALLSSTDGFLQPDPNIDVIKIAVVNRYTQKIPAVSFIRNFGLKKGSIASSVSHDSHNIIAAGVSEKDIADSINWIIRNKGGISVSTGENVYGLPLPVAGIMSGKPAEIVSEKYSFLSDMAKTLGCKIDEPFMTLSFMGLLVIPELKLSDQGLFDVNTFNFTGIYV
jgi:adenine deaminase